MKGVLRFAGTRIGRADPLVVAAAALVVWPTPASLVSSGLIESLLPLPWLAVGGVVVGWLLARFPVAWPLAHLVGAILGLELAAVLSGMAAGLPWGIPAAPPSGYLVGTSTGLLVWLLGYSSAWWLFRSDAAWSVVLVNGVALVMNLSYAPPDTAGYLPRFVLSALLLLAVHEAARRQSNWEWARLAVEPGVAGRALVAGLLAAAIVPSAAAALPVTRSAVFAEGWESAFDAWRSVERDLQRWTGFARIDSAPRGLNFSRTLAPRDPFDLDDTPVLRVRSASPVYLRATTADRYTGQAMSATAPVLVERREAGQDLLPSASPPRGRVSQDVEVTVLAARSGVAFAPDVPRRISRDVELEARADAEDVASMRFESPLRQGDSYVVDAFVPRATPAELRAAGLEYATPIRQRYLQVPSNLPERVRLLGSEVTRGADTPYDRAVVLEQYFRETMHYSTRVTPAPADRDWADYVLFSSREGYCDYFAVTMAVLLRTQGVPARVASGFAPGDQEEGPGRWLVRESHAHSWVETYFPGYGWIPFEPSSIRALPARTENSASNTTEAGAPGRTLAGQDERSVRGLPLREFPADGTGQASERVPVLALAALLLAAGIGAYLAVLRLWRRGLRGLSGSSRAYAELLRMGAWLRVLPVGPGRTPRALVETLARAVPPSSQTIRAVGAAYAEVAYRGRPVTEDVAVQWKRERGRIGIGLLAATLARSVLALGCRWGQPRRPGRAHPRTQPGGLGGWHSPPEEKNIPLPREGARGWASPNAMERRGE